MVATSLQVPFDRQMLIKRYVLKIMKLSIFVVLQNFERGVHEAAAMKTNTNQLGTAEMLQQFASIFKSPALSSSSTSSNAVVNRDLQSPLLRNNRDLGLRDSLVVR